MIADMKTLTFSSTLGEGGHGGTTKDREGRWLTGKRSKDDPQSKDSDYSPLCGRRG